MEQPSQKFGQRFVFGLIITLLVGVLIYVLAHIFVTGFTYSCEEQRDQCQNQGQASWVLFASIDDNGEVAFFNKRDLHWYVGQEEAEVAIAAITERNAEILTKRVKVTASIRALREKTKERERNSLYSIEDLVMKGHYNNAFARAMEIDAKLAANNSREGIRLVAEELENLRRLKQQQYVNLSDLSPPLAQLFFWTTPTLSVLEVLFWAFFGVITNLLVNSAEYLRNGNFVPNERWVAYTKLVYGPILAMVMVLAIIFGWFNLGSYETRVWTLPLVGFIFGYSARRTAQLFDKLQEKVFGAAEKSIAQGPAQILAARRAGLGRLRELARPRNLEELKQDAKKIAEEEVAQTVIGKGEKS